MTSMVLLHTVMAAKYTSIVSTDLVLLNNSKNNFLEFVNVWLHGLAFEQ